MKAGPTIDEVLARLIDEPFAFHADDGEPRVWNAAPQSLRLLAGHLAPGMRTLETGAGASTVVFAAAGTRHTAVSPDPYEHRRVREYCDAQGIDHTRIEFVAARSADVLPELTRAESIDVALIDGAHAFPAAVLDWYYVSRSLRVGGALLLDDIPIPSVAVVFCHMAGEPAWQLIEIVDDRAAAFRKVAEEPGGDPWQAQPFNRGYPDFSFAAPTARFGMYLRHALGHARAKAGARYPALGRLRRRIARGR